MDHINGNNFMLQEMLERLSRTSLLHGLYYWGHGRWPYPSKGLITRSKDRLLTYSMINLNYKMALGLVFACDSNSGKSSLFSNTPGSIWKGYSGTLYPITDYYVGYYIKQGQQNTNNVNNKI